MTLTAERLAEIKDFIENDDQYFETPIDVVQELLREIEFLYDQFGINDATDGDKVILAWMESSYHSHKKGYRDSIDPLDLVNWVTCRGWDEIRQICALAELVTDERIKNREMQKNLSISEIGGML